MITFTISNNFFFRNIIIHKILISINKYIQIINQYSSTISTKRIIVKDQNIFTNDHHYSSILLFLKWSSILFIHSSHSVKRNPSFINIHFCSLFSQVCKKLERSCKYTVYLSLNAIRSNFKPRHRRWNCFQLESACTMLTDHFLPNR